MDIQHSSAAPSASSTDICRPNHEPRPVHLELLPLEILTSILEFLVPQPPELGETRPVSYNKLVPGESWFDFTRCRRGLWSLCLVNRRFSNLAYPLLYRIMAVLDEESMILFFRTLTERHEYGGWTRYLSVHLTLSRDSVIRETRRVMGQLLRTFRPATKLSPPLDIVTHALELMKHSLPALSTREGDFDDVPQVIVVFILMFLNRLETLLLQIPICDDHPDYHALVSKLEAALVYAPPGSTFCDPALIPFQHIETLLLQGDPETLEHFENDDCSCDVPETWGCQARVYHRMFACFPRLTTLEVSADDGCWDNELDPDTVNFLSGGESRPYLRGIRHLYLHNSCAGPTDLYQILVNAPDLETLYMTPSPSDGSHHGPPQDTTHADPEALDVALTEHARNLRHLDVAWYEWYGAEAEIGQDGRLASLPRLDKIEKLCIQLAVLYGTQPATALDTPLAERLPPNLVDLTLEDWWWSSLDTYERMEDWTIEDQVEHYRSQADYRRTALRMLEQFARDARERLPRLRKVLLLCKIPWTWMMQNAMELDFHFHEVRDLFARQGVKFLVEESSEWILERDVLEICD